MDETDIVGRRDIHGQIFQPEVHNFAAPNKAERQRTGQLDAGTGMKALRIEKRQAGATDRPLPDGMEIEVTGVTERAGFGEVEAKAHRGF